MIRFYQDEGLTLDEGFTELPDHITVELEFLYFLITVELRALQSTGVDSFIRSFEKQKYFLENYMLNWVPRFCEMIETETTLEYYRSLARCLRMFLTEFEANIAIPESVISLIEEETTDANA